MKNFNSFMWLRGYGLKRVGRILACLTLLLTLACGQVWGAVGTSASSTFTCGTTSTSGVAYAFTFDSDGANSDTIIFHGASLYNSSVTYAYYSGQTPAVSSNDFAPRIYNAVMGTSLSSSKGLYSEGGSTNPNELRVQSGKILWVKVTNCTAVLLSGKSGGSRTTNLDVYLSGDLENPISGGSKTIANTASDVAVTGMTASNTYFIKISGSESSNCAVYELALVYPHAASCDAAPDAPSAFAKSSVTATTATFSITDAANAASYDIYCSTSSSSPDGETTPTATGITTKTPTITSLTSGTTYYAWVRAVCDASYKSSWVALTGSTFTTKAQYTITYNKGANGTGSISAGTKTEGEDFTLSSSVFTRDSYAQTGWATSDGGSKAYDLGGTYSTDAAITLYPVWTATTTYTFDYSNSKSISTLEGEGWTFNSSSTTSMTDNGEFVNLVKTFTDNDISTPGTDGSGNDYSIAFAKSSSAYAKFDLGAATTVTSLTGSMKVGTNGSSTAWKSITIKFIGSDGSTVKATYTKDHSTASWTADALSYTTPVADVQYIQIQGANKWQILDELNISYVPVTSGYTVTYDANGGTGTMTDSDSPYEAGATVTVLTNTFTKAGYSFSSWSAVDAGSNVIDVSSGSFTMPSANVTITAQWTELVDKFQDKEHGKAEKTKSGANQTTPTCLDTSPGDYCDGKHYKFIGWVLSTSVNDDGTLKNDAVIVPGGQSGWVCTGSTYYAVWAAENE